MSTKKQRLQWSTQKRRVRDLIISAKNPNTNTNKQFRNLKKSLRDTGYAEIIAVDVDNTIVAGAHRKQALMEMGRADEEIDVRVPCRKLTQKEFDRYLIASNALKGTWDFEKLKSFDLGTLTISGLDDDTLSKIWDQNLQVEDDEWDEEKELAKIKIPKTKLGDLILMGQHKLICGDSTDPVVLKKLFGKDRASMIYSDPKYNIGLDYNSGLGGKQNYGGSVDDNLTDDAYREFLKKSLVNALSVAKDDVHVFYWCDQTYIWLVQQLYRELGIINRRVCLWLKNGQNPTPDVAFSKCYEPNCYGVRGRPYITKAIQNLNEVINQETSTGNNLLGEAFDHLSVWATKRLSGKDREEHATSKPPKLHEKAIRRCSKPGDIILDSFLGSGSTLVAAEQLKRRCYGVELEPIFCDLIIRRYEKLTGKKAKILSTNHGKEE